MYGSSRLGSININRILPANPPDNLEGNRYRTQKSFELSNHLGNVLTTVADRKVGAPTPLDPAILDFYYAEATSARDYYAFGQEISSRSFNHQTLGTSDSRYGFNED